MRIVKEMVGCTFEDSPLDHSMWDYAVQYAAIIRVKTSAGKDDLSTWTQYTGRDEVLFACYDRHAQRHGYMSSSRSPERQLGSQPISADGS